MKIVLIGYGKMGKAIERIALHAGHEIVLKIDETNAESFTVAELAKADVAIEFTSPDAAFNNVMKCFEANVPVVCGTTGWNDKLDEAKKTCIKKNQSFFYSSNFSIGVNIFFEINKRLAELMNRQPSYKEISITEIHHTQKKDMPSGTAITLADEIIRNLTRLQKWESYDAAALPPGEIKIADGSLPIKSMRAGDVAGIHEITYKSDEDSIIIVHNAASRMGFAKGAVMAAEFLIGKSGVYNMKDLLNF